LNHLKAEKILTNIDPELTEVRSWVFMQIYRAAVQDIARATATGTN
jgi:hypothetical protein